MDVIGFCGRMRSGKGTLANVCEKMGYEKISFALPMKMLCAELLGVTIEELDDLKNKMEDISFKIDEGICKRLSQETNIDEITVRDECLSKTLTNVREMLQFIGTDLIRKYDSDWHVNSTIKLMKMGKKYVFEDVRFPNEKKAIENLGGICWFVVRPKIDNVSNHPSETALKWMDCWNKIIINDKTAEYLMFKWETFMEDYDKSCKAREKEMNAILKKGKEVDEEDMSIQEMLFISKDLFNYERLNIDKDDIVSMNLDESTKELKLHLKGGIEEIITNPLQIEDLKLYI